MPYPTLRGRFIWHELMTTDTNAAIAFYKKVVGWKTESWDQNPSYTMWMAKRGPVGGVMLLPEDAKAMGAPPSWLAYIGTPDIDGTVRETVRLGGRVLKESTAIPSVGRFAVLSDPEGAVFAVLQPERPMPVHDVPELGEYSWHELVTTDPEAGFRFYQELFGWEKTDGMDMGPMGIYQMYGWPGLNLGGIYKKPADMPAPSHWLGYVSVADSKRAAAVIGKNGGKVMHGPVQVPGGGWITAAMDPEGVAFAIHSRPVVKPAAKAPATRKGKKKAKRAGAKTAKGAKSAKTAKRAKKARPQKASKKRAR